jgi:hypothetical protein
LRQAAGPLIENLPIVLTGDPDQVGTELSALVVTANRSPKTPSHEDHIVVPLRFFALPPRAVSARLGT